MTARFIALALFTIAVLPQLGCSGDSSDVSASDDSFTTVANGLWALDGDAAHGDIELLQVDTRTFASLTHRDAPARARSVSAAAAAPSSPEDDAEADTGRLARTSAGAAAPIVLAVGDTQYAVVETPDTLTLTAADGRVLTYHRSYRLYCVAEDRGVEATVLLELGKEPKIVGVNGDGRTFPGEGTYGATMRSDVLFRLKDYVLTSDLGDGAVVTVKLPWSDMSKSMIEGTIAISGISNAASPTALSCERILTPAPTATPAPTTTPPAP